MPYAHTSTGWNWIYYALGAFAVFSTGAAVHLSHTLLQEYRASVAVNQKWAERTTSYAEWGMVAFEGNAPGNDVFESLDVEGEITAEGLATRQPLRGTLALDVPATGMLPYDFSFQGDDGERYRFVGQKRVRALALVDTMTRLPARVVAEDGREIAVAEVFFDLAELPGFLWGWRLARQ